MNNAAFVVYYEERRYSDTRLEPQTPGLRAQQNGFKRETLTALEDLRAELRFLAKQPKVNADDVVDVMRYGTSARVAMDSYLRVSGMSSE